MIYSEKYIDKLNEINKLYKSEVRGLYQYIKNIVVAINDNELER